MSDRPLVSVVIPDKNRPQLVLEAIHSVFSQSQISPRDIEVILVVDHNLDYPRQEILASYPQVTIINNADKEGPGGSRNTGLKYARGKYVIFLDSDDQLKSDFVSRMITSLDGDQRASAVVCLSVIVFAKNFPLKERPKIRLFVFLRNFGLLLGYLLDQGYAYPSSFYFCQMSHMVFRRSMVGKLKFNYDYRRGGEDWDFVIKAQKKGPIRVVPWRLLLFRYSMGSSTFTPANLSLKWQSYSLLISRLPRRLKTGLFHLLLKLYIKRYGPKNP